MMARYVWCSFARDEGGFLGAIVLEAENTPAAIAVALKDTGAMRGIGEDIEGEMLAVSFEVPDALPEGLVGRFCLGYEETANLDAAIEPFLTGGSE